MYRVCCVERSDFESGFDCYFIHEHSTGAKDRLAAESSVQGQVWGWEGRNKKRSPQFSGKYKLLYHA